MSFKYLITCIPTIFLFNFCITTPVLQQQTYSNPLCQDGINFSNGICSPNNCPATHFYQNGGCVFGGISRPVLAQPYQTVNNCLTTTQCSTSCCQTAFQPPCQLQPPCQAQLLCQPQPTCQLQPPCQTQPPCQPQQTYPIQITIVKQDYEPEPNKSTIVTRVTTESPEPTTTKICGHGRVFINGSCHPVYCGSGIYIRGRCVAAVCTEGKIWDGNSCKVPDVQYNETVLMSTTIITNDFNRSKDIGEINYTNNLVINITESPPSEKIQESIPPQIIYVNSPPAPVRYIQLPPPPAPVRYIQLPPAPPPAPSHPSPNCCTITTPNTCLWEDRYVCRSHSYQQCGEVCTHQHLNLRPPVVRQPPESCIHSGCYNQQPFYPDCYGCRGDMITESSYCQTYCQNTGCMTNSCGSLDLRTYCGSYPGAIGCRQVDGYTQDWSMYY